MKAVKVFDFAAAIPTVTNTLSWSVSPNALNETTAVDEIQSVATPPVFPNLGCPERPNPTGPPSEPSLPITVMDVDPVDGPFPRTIPLTNPISTLNIITPLTPCPVIPPVATIVRLFPPPPPPAAAFFPTTLDVDIHIDASAPDPPIRILLDDRPPRADPLTIVIETADVEGWLTGEMDDAAPLFAML